MKVTSSALTADQMEMRRGKIGASDISAIAGVNPWRKPIDAWLSITGRAQQSDRKPMATRLGNLFEAAIVEVWREDNGMPVLETPGSMQDPAHPWRIATPDRLLPGVAVLEVKLVGVRIMHHWDDNEVPPYVLTQIQHQMAVADVGQGWVLACVGGTDYRCEPVPRDQVTIDALTEIGERFHRNHIVTDRPPPVDESPAWQGYFADLFPKARKPLEKAKTKEAEIAGEILNARADKAKAEAREKAARHRLMEVIGDREGLYGDGWRATLKPRGNSDKRTLTVTERK